jgi:hypothetical protein
MPHCVSISSASVMPPSKTRRTPTASSPMTTAIATDTPVTSIRFGRTGDRHVGGVDQACRADLAGLQQPQLLHVIEQGLVKLRVDLHIAHQAHHVLFHVRQLLDLAGDAVELRGQACDLAVQDFDRGVIRGEAHDQFLALLTQFLQLAWICTDCARISFDSSLRSIVPRWLRIAL